MNLSPHFALDEFTISQTAARHGIDNTPPREVFDNLARLAAILEDVRALFGRPLVISSGYRCEALNKMVGGVPDSAHVKGLAADLILPGTPPTEVARTIIASAISYDQVILEFDRWTHFAIPALSAVARSDVLTIRTGTGYMRGLC